MAFPQYAVITELDFSATGLDYQQFSSTTTPEFIPMFLQWVSDGKTPSNAEWGIDQFLIAPQKIKRFWIDNMSAQDYITFSNTIQAQHGIPQNQMVWTIIPNTQ